MATLEDWKAKIAGRSDLDKSEFAGFIPRDGNQEFLREAFGTLPRGNELIRRIQQVLSENDNSAPYVIPKKENWRPEQELLPLLHQYRKSTRDFLYTKGRQEIAGFLESEQVRVVYDNNEFLETIRSNSDYYSEADEAVGDEFNRKIIGVGTYMISLKEAVLFLTKYPGVTRYIMQETAGFELNHISYYQLWRAGGDVYFFEDYSLLLCEYGQT